MWELGPRYPDLCFMRGVSKDHPISLSGPMRADRQSSLRGTLLVPSPSVASPTPTAPFYPLNIQVFSESLPQSFSPATRLAVPVLVLRSLQGSTMISIDSPVPTCHIF